MARLAVPVIRALALSGLLTLAALPLAVGGPAPEDPRHQEDEQACASPGTDAAATAVVRTGGAVRVVSFEVGWDVYTGRRPGELLAVCSPGS